MVRWEVGGRVSKAKRIKTGSVYTFVRVAREITEESQVCYKYPTKQVLHTSLSNRKKRRYPEGFLPEDVVERRPLYFPRYAYSSLSSVFGRSEIKIDSFTGHSGTWREG